MKLKCLFLTVVALLFVFTGCNKDAFFDEGSDANLKSAELKMVSISWDINVLLDEFGINSGEYTPIGKTVEGTISHLGKLDGASFWKALRYDRYNDVPYPYIDYKITGKLVAANGDELNFSTEGFMYTYGNENGVNWDEKMYFSGGTGRFENVVGEGDAIGVLFRNEQGIPVRVTMHLEGVLSTVGSSKK